MLTIIKNYKTILQLALVFCVPAFLYAIIGLFFIADFILYLKEVIALSAVTFLFFLVVLLFPLNNKKAVIFKVLTLLLFVILFIKLTFFILFKSMINASAFFIIFETNQTEALDFLSYYIDYRIVSLALLLFISLFMVLKKVNLQALKSFKLNPLKAIVLCIGIILCSILIVKKFKNQDLVLITSKAIQDYSEITSKMSSVLAKPFNPEITTTKTDDSPKTIVVVIGESTTKHHMSLYGYTRKTNPLLSSIKDELLIFEDVISPNVHTIAALTKTLTLSEKANSSPTLNTSVVQLANQAGFETYWISNQKPVGINETSVTLIAEAAKHKTYLASQGFEYEIYDTSITQELEKALKQAPKQKLIFLHLMGTHGAYNKRYPSGFKTFNDEPNSKFSLTPQAISRINEYDTAVKYNDSIVYSIIEKTKLKADNSIVLYFSDHGEDVFDTSADFLGHNEYFGTKPMYDIPFLIWQSPKYKTTHKIINQISELEHRAYILEDFIHTFIDVLDVKSNVFRPERSVLNPKFKPKKRIIKNDTDYDKAF